MRNQKKFLLLVLAMVICLGLYSLCVFLIANDYTIALWIAYSFTVLAIVIEFTVPMISGGEGNVKAVPILGLSLITVTTAYFFIQLIIGIILMVAGARTKVVVIICAIVLAVYLLIILTSCMGTSHIAGVETAVKSSTASIKTMTAIVELSYNNEKDEAKKKILKQLLDAIRYSDPVSSTDDIRMLDNKIDAAIHTIRGVESTCSADELEKAVGQALELVEERNIRCKLSK